MLTETALRPYLTMLVPELKAKRTRLKPVLEHIRMENKTLAARGQTKEHRYLDSLTHSPWGLRIASTYAQELNVSGFRTPDSDPTVNDPAWGLWRKARMAIMQDIVIREAFQYGESFCAALSTTTPGDVIAKPLPPVHTVALYDDPVTDVWPIAVLSTVADRKTAKTVTGTLYVSDWVYVVDFPDGLDAETATFGDAWQHNAEQTPVVRFFDEIDSEGHTTGKIAPLLSILERIRKDTYDRQLIQHKSSWKVRTMTGIEPDDNQTPDQAKMRLSQEDILVSSDPLAKFGTLDETPLDNLIAAKEADLFELCSLAQIPPSAIMPGKISNVSAETIAELRSSFENRNADHKDVLGDSYRWLIQALAVQAGVEFDEDAEPQWQDRSSRSLAQAMDAWSKGAPALEIPREAAWERLPGVTGQDVTRWSNMRKREAGRAAVASIFAVPPTAPEPAPTEPAPDTQVPA